MAEVVQYNADNSAVDGLGGGSFSYPTAGLVKSTGSAWAASITDSSANWNTAYGWGNHASAGYLTGVTADAPLSGVGTSASHLTVDLSSKQNADAGLTSLAGLSYASASFVKMTGADTFTLDTNTYGDVTASANMTDHTIIRGDGGAKGIQDTGLVIDDSDNLIMPDGTNIEADHILEAAADHGVSVDGLLIKDGALPTTYIASGTYTPTFTNTSNVAASTPGVCHYTRINSIVCVAGRIDIDPSSATTLTYGTLSLPIASDFTLNSDCGGAGAGDQTANCPVEIEGDTTNNGAQLVFVPNSNANRAYTFIFQYVIK